MIRTYAIVFAFAVGALLATLSGAHADPSPALDRQLVERMVRALEAQAHATDRLVQATERCQR